MISKKSLLAVAVALSLPALAMAQNSARSGFTPDLRAAAPNSVFAPNATITEAFDVVPGTPPCPTGWVCKNNSAPVGTSNWFQGNPAVFSAQAGAATAYIGANFNNTAGAGTISNWLISPVVQFGTGAELRFWARVNTGPTDYADRLEIRASSTGTDTGASATSIGDFSVLLGTINPTLTIASGTCVTPAAAPNAGGFPEDWCEYRLTTTNGLPLTGSGHIAFRYYVTSGGPSGTSSNYFGIDTFSFVEGSVGVPLTSTPVSGSVVTLPGQTLGGAATTAPVTFQNPGVAAATVTCTNPVASQFTLTPLVISVPAGGNAATTISFTSSVAGTFPGQLICTSGAQTFTFDLSGTTAAGSAGGPARAVPALGSLSQLLMLLGVLGAGLVGVNLVSRRS